MRHTLADNRILSGLFAYWLQKKGARSMPRRSDIEPTEIPRLLPHLQFIERVENGRFRYRLTGTAVVEAYGRELTGLYVDEMLPEQNRRIAEETYLGVYERPRALLVRKTYSDIVAERLILPLSDDDKTVSMLLTGNTYAFDKWPMQHLASAALLAHDVHVTEMSAEAAAATV